MIKRNKKTIKAGETIPVIVKKGNIDVPGRLSLLNRKQPHAVLATVSGNEPYTSLISYAVTPDIKGLLFATPRGTRKFSNLMKNRRVCLLIDSRSGTAGDYMKTESVTVIGKAGIVRNGRVREELSRIFLKKHPLLTEFVYAPSTSLILVKIIKCIHVSSFQTFSEWP
jgi:nitroimidazol reductase NimA-like FMN-containing flavoprotein (pyridoxamine 5'-phosphate oxidase superfamily)